MSKKNWIILTILLLIVFGIGFIIYSLQKVTDKDISKNNTNLKTNNTSNVNNNANKENISKENETNLENKKPVEQKKEVQYKEEELSSFSTKIYSKDSARQNNIKITCNTLNDKTVKNSETFSFCNTVGKATSERGYQEADIYDHDGNKKKGLRRRKLSNKFYLI